MNKSYIYFFIFLVLSSFTFALTISSPSANQNVSKYLNVSFVEPSNFSYFNVFVNSNLVNIPLINYSDSNQVSTSSTVYVNSLTYTFNSTFNFIDFINTSLGGNSGISNGCIKIELVYTNNSRFNSSEFCSNFNFNASNYSISNPFYNSSLSSFNIWLKVASGGSIVSPRTLTGGNPLSFTAFSHNSSFNISTYPLFLPFGINNVSVYSYRSNGSLVDNKNVSFNLTSNSLLSILPLNSLSQNIVYNLSLKDLTSNVITSVSNVNDSSSFDVIIGRTYQYNISALNYATTVANFTILNVSSYQLNLTIEAFNTMIISIVDERTNTSITQPISISVQTNNSLNNYSTSSGFINITNAATGINILTFTSTNYSTRSYTVNLSEASYELLTIRLLNNGNSTVIGMYTKTSTYQLLPNVLYTIQKQYTGGSYATVLQGFTDEAGFATFSIDTTVNYRMILSVDGYVTKQFNQQFYVANSPYTFVLNSVSSTPYINVFDNVQYYFSPTITQLNHSIYNFSMTSYSASVPIAWTSVNVNGSITTVYGSLSGGTASAIVDLSNVNGSLPVIFSFNYYDVNVDDYLTYSIPIGYYVAYDVAYNNSLPIAMNNLKDDVDSSAWLGILAVLIIFAGVATVMQLSNNMLAGVMTGFAIMVFLAFIGWISGLLVAIIIILSILALYSDQGGF